MNEDRSVNGGSCLTLYRCKDATYLWIYGHKNETIRLISKFPPLPLSVKRVQIYGASSEARRWMRGTGSLSKVYNLDDLRPHAKKQEQAKLRKQGRIIR